MSSPALGGPSLRWDPGQYLRYGDERSRPFFELLTRVGAEDPATVVDLGCGPGNVTAHLLERWPAARVTGVDSSPEMIAAAAAVAVPGRLDFELGDVRTWRPPAPVDVIVSNATLQWVPGHLELLPDLVGALRPGGWLAFQVPGNFGAPSHLSLFALAAQERWADRLGPVLRQQPVAEPAEYLRALTDLGSRADVWETTYQHVLSGPDAVLEWTRGTALRPVLTALAPGEAVEFEAAYRDELRRLYPTSAFGTVFAFRRIFAVAQRPG